LFSLISLKSTERSEALSAKHSSASEYFEFLFFTRSFASRY
jgi:hypothetical protein